MDRQKGLLLELFNQSFLLLFFLESLSFSCIQRHQDSAFLLLSLPFLKNLKEESRPRPQTKAGDVSLALSSILQEKEYCPNYIKKKKYF